MAPTGAGYVLARTLNPGVIGGPKSSYGCRSFILDLSPVVYHTLLVPEGAWKAIKNCWLGASLKSVITSDSGYATVILVVRQKRGGHITSLGGTRCPLGQDLYPSMFFV